VVLLNRDLGVFAATMNAELHARASTNGNARLRFSSNNAEHD
jgi:hypothetical protein